MQNKLYTSLTQKIQILEQSRLGSIRTRNRMAFNNTQPPTNPQIGNKTLANIILASDKYHTAGRSVWWVTKGGGGGLRVRVR